MKARIITVVAVLGVMTMLSSGEVFAGRGGGGGNGGGGGGYGGGGMGQAAGSGTKQQSQTQTQTRTRAHNQVNNETMSATRPADSQRRDGSFLTTGTTANGSSIRPGNGQGLQDGSRLTTTTTAVPTAAP